MYSSARVQAVACGLVLTMFAQSASAAPAVPEPPDRYTEAQQLLEADDYVGAAEIWEQMLDASSESAETHTRREAMIINVIDARLEAYARHVTALGEREPLHLFAAQLSLRRYLRSYGAAYGSSRALSVPVQERAAALALALAEADPERNTPPPTSIDATPRPASPARAPVPRSSNNGNGLIVGGIGVGVLGLAVGLTMIPLGAALGRNADNIYTVAVINASNTSSEPQRSLYLADAAEAERAGKTANRVAIAGGVLSPLLLGGAAAMVVLGLQRHRAAQPHHIQHGPQVSPDYAGYSAKFRF